MGGRPLARGQGMHPRGSTAEPSDWCQAGQLGLWQRFAVCSGGGVVRRVRAVVGGPLPQGYVENPLVPVDYVNTMGVTHIEETEDLIERLGHLGVKAQMEFFEGEVRQGQGMSLLRQQGPW